MGHRLLTRLALPVCLIVLASGPCAAQAWVDEGWADWQRELTTRQQPEKVMDVIGLKFLPDDTIFVLRVASGPLVGRQS